jgi:hypothetical protein
VKFIKLLIIGAVLAAAVTSYAESTNTVTAPTQGQLLGDLGQVGEDIWADISTLQLFTTNSDAMLQVGGGINTAQPHQGIVAVALTVPLATASNSLGSFTASAGCFGAYSGDGVWEDGAAAFQIGQAYTIPVIGTVYQFAEDGLSHNWKTGDYGNFAATGFEKTWTINENIEIGAGAMVANDSTRNGVDLLGGAHLTVHF